MKKFFRIASNNFFYFTYVLYLNICNRIIEIELSC